MCLIHLYSLCMPILLPCNTSTYFTFTNKLGSADISKNQLIIHKWLSLELPRIFSWQFCNPWHSPSHSFIPHSGLGFLFFISFYIMLTFQLCLLTTDTRKLHIVLLACVWFFSKLKLMCKNAQWLMETVSRQLSRK